jgi:hypothetical protein
MADLEALLDEEVPACPSTADLEKLIGALESRINASNLEEVTKSGDLKLALHRSCKITAQIRNGLDVGPDLDLFLSYLQQFKSRLMNIGAYIPETVADCLTEIARSLNMFAEEALAEGSPRELRYYYIP